MLLTWDSVEFIHLSFFFHYWVSITRWWKDTRLISDKTRIKDLSFGYSFNETYHVSECWFIQKVSSFFFLRVLCAALFWNLGFFISQRQFLLCLHPSRNKRQLSYFPWFENSPRVDFFSGLSLGTKYDQGFASPLTHTWLIESEVLHAYLTL